jgi:hypothetical protein
MKTYHYHTFQSDPNFQERRYNKQDIDASPCLFLKATLKIKDQPQKPYRDNCEGEQVRLPEASKVNLNTATENTSFSRGRY